MPLSSDEPVLRTEPSRFHGLVIAQVNLEMSVGNYAGCNKDEEPHTENLPGIPL
jgi:hypothetical protein